jgi:predicted DsbA family dithiol-disulfide isomerase
MDEPVRLIVWSDYLCPWCYVAATRLHRLREELGDRVALEWRSYLLRPYPNRSRTLEEFRTYTRSWARPAAEPDAPPFRVWESDAGPPSHSMPPHLVAKAAATFGPEAFERMHARLLAAYFGENLDISDPDTLMALWRDVGLPAGDFARAGDQALVDAVVREHNQAVSLGLTGVPAVQMAGNDVPLPGALPYESYRRWVERASGGAGARSSTASSRPSR